MLSFSYSSTGQYFFFFCKSNPSFEAQIQAWGTDLSLEPQITALHWSSAPSGPSHPHILSLTVSGVSGSSDHLTLLRLLQVVISKEDPRAAALSHDFNSQLHYLFSHSSFRCFVFPLKDLKLVRLVVFIVIIHCYNCRHHASVGIVVVIRRHHRSH